MASLTVIVPAYNEEGNLEATVRGVIPVLERRFSDYEILIFDDSSRDGTGKIADRLASENKKIQVIHNPQNRGLGYNYKSGVKMSRMDYVIMVPGDRDILEETFDPLFAQVGKADIVVAYTENMGVRPWNRRFLSYAFTGIMNLLFGLRLKYFNGIVIHRRALIQGVEIKTDGFAYQAEALIKLIRKGATYAHAPQQIRERAYGASKALGPRNVARVLKTMAQLFCEVHFSRP